MLRTDLRQEASRPQEIAEKIELMGWHKLRPREKTLCQKHIRTVLRYLSADKRKLVAAIHNVCPSTRTRQHVGKSFLIEQHKRKLSNRRRELGARLTKMTLAETNRWLKSAVT
jgi:hypothetical protein